MSKRGSEPQEAIGPVVDGLENFQFPPVEDALEEFAPAAFDEAVEAEEEKVTSVLLVCGNSEVAQSVGNLAIKCDFVLEIATDGDEESALSRWPLANAAYQVPNWDGIVDICHIDRNCFVCVFVDSMEDSEDILAQCLPSDARYLGAFGNMETRSELFEGLRKMGAPDAELMAIACPMGLNIGAETADQQAVAIVAELMAARAGTLKRLRHGEGRPRKR